MKDRIEAIYRPIFESLGTELGQRYPAVQFSMYCGAIGALIEYRGWHLGIEATFGGRGSHESDSVALSIELCHLDRTPRVMADVFWGAPCGECEATLWDWEGTNDAWPQLDESVYDELVRGIPTLIQVFAKAVERGRPRSSNEVLN